MAGAAVIALLGGAALMRGNHVFEAGEIAHGLFETEERSASGVRLVALNQRAPLRRRHRAGPGVGQEIDQHVVAAQLEHVVVGARQRGFTLRTRRELQRFDGFDPERLDNRRKRMHFKSESRASVGRRRR